MMKKRMKQLKILIGVFHFSVVNNVTDGQSCQGSESKMREMKLGLPTFRK